MEFRITAAMNAQHLHASRSAESNSDWDKLMLHTAPRGSEQSSFYNLSTKNRMHASPVEDYERPAGLADKSTEAYSKQIKLKLS